MDVSKLIKAIDELLERSELDSVNPVEANAYLERKGILKDSHDRPGKPLREILRAGKFPHAYQEGRLWKIPHSKFSKQRGEEAIVRLSYETHCSLKPVVGKNSTILILGSMPGKESLARHEYYSNRKNRFWGILSGIYNVAMPSTYRNRMDFLINRGIALWDVYHSVRRHGSLDANIASGSFNDIKGFLKKNPSIRVIVLNGTKAAKAFKLYMQKERCDLKKDIDIYSVLSSSGANCQYSLEELIEDWRIPFEST